MEKSETNDDFSKRKRRLIKSPSSILFYNKNIKDNRFNRNEIYVSSFSEMKLINSKNNFCLQRNNEDNAKKYIKIKSIFNFNNNNINYFRGRNKNFIEGNKCNDNKINGSNSMLKPVTLVKSNSCDVLI